MHDANENNPNNPRVDWKFNRWVGKAFWALLLIIWGIAIYAHTYYRTDGNTATQGIVLQRTIHLDQYKIIGTSFQWGCLGQATMYSRSDRHEHIGVCK